ncbi:DUF5665 domain-containing protein [Rhodobacteraceae bacterium N5(2021)]|uniref:DUF5665 domain-containing protein n=1 Tax=Gymnodinialimonas phycosphaerae TaxID=2841589 RepID=A0A975TSR6_9RHOB|nr:DUF5665 domain-containing protein [Gymnodinialimonas phycosphaerae]MBY4893391.1 DUF5665 domain-containing protein [Gymnodinialimonas phycosphaerae]
MPEPDQTPPRATDTPGLEAEVRALREELSFLRRHRMFVIYQSVPRILFFRFAVGMAAGLGTVIGATVLLSVIIWALSQIEFLPIIGEWSAQIAQQIDAAVNGAD